MTAIAIDIESIRWRRGNVADDAGSLRYFDRVITLSPSMSKLLKAVGYKGSTSPMGLWDYHPSVPCLRKRHNSGSVAFAGNLEKSVFLPSLKDLGLKNVKVLLYGLPEPVGVCDDHIVYMGFFKSSDLSGLEGSWGLVWDGDTVEALSGYLGRYMAINSPSKASLYLAAGMPLIVPAGTAVAEAVRQNGLGIVLESLRDLESAISGITDTEYERIAGNVSRYAAGLLEGHNLLAAMSVWNCESEKLKSDYTADQLVRMFAE